MTSTQQTVAVGNTWSKGRNGDWLVRGAAGQIHADGYSQAVQVAKRDGTSTLATIVREVWSDGQVALYTVAPAAQSSARRGRWTGCSCGSIEGQPRKSDCLTCRIDND